MAKNSSFWPYSFGSLFLQEGFNSLPAIQETAYPRLKNNVSARDLSTLYTPTPVEIALAEKATRGNAAFLGFLILLKTFQRLGYFVLVSQVPLPIVEHIAQTTRTEAALLDLPGYDTSGTRFRHLHVIRDYLHIRPCGKEARRAMLLAMQEAARTKEHLADPVNVGIEELVRQKYELPVFDTLVRGARHGVLGTIERKTGLRNFGSAGERSSGGE